MNRLFLKLQPELVTRRKMWFLPHENDRKGDHAACVASAGVSQSCREPLSRLESSGGYYALVKKGGKQFRRSLKTKDRRLADRRLKDIKSQGGSLAVSDDAKLGFEAVADRWLDSIKHTLAPGTIRHREIHIKNVAPCFSVAQFVGCFREFSLCSIGSTSIYRGRCNVVWFEIGGKAEMQLAELDAAIGASATASNTAPRYIAVFEKKALPVFRKKTVTILFAI